MKHFIEKHGLVIWQDDTGSGITSPGDDIWHEYQDFLNVGGEPERPPKQNVDMATAMQMISDEVTRVSAEYRIRFTQAELDSWPLQDAEAKAWLASNDAATPLLDAMMLPWEDKQAFCEALLAQHAAYAKAIGDLMAWRRIAEAAIEVYFAQGSRDSVTIRYPEVPYAS